MLEKEGCIVCYPSRDYYSDVQAVLEDSDLMNIITAYSAEKIILRGSRDKLFTPLGACNSPFSKEKELLGQKKS